MFGAETTYGISTCDRHGFTPGFQSKGMDTSFTAVTFNILARSLGSSVIPWVINVSEHARDIVRRSRVVKPEFDIKTWLRTTAEPEYKKHFHRNFASGNKECMRSMWSACIDRQSHVPAILASVLCVEPDKLQYPSASEDSGAQRSLSDAGAGHKLQGEAQRVTAISLRGLLRRDISDVADELYEEFVKDEPFFRWETRGPQIFQTVTKNATSNFHPAECSHKLSDIVTLCEVCNHAATCAHVVACAYCAHTFMQPV